MFNYRIKEMRMLANWRSLSWETAQVSCPMKTNREKTPLWMAIWLGLNLHACHSSTWKSDFTKVTCGSFSTKSKFFSWRLRCTSVGAYSKYFTPLRHFFKISLYSYCHFPAISELWSLTLYLRQREKEKALSARSLSVVIPLVWESKVFTISILPS